MLKKISTQAAVAIFITITIIMVIFGLYSIITQWNSEIGELKIKENRITRRIANNITVPMWNYDMEAAEAIIEHELHDEDLNGILIYESSDKIFIGRIRNLKMELVDYDEDTHRESLKESSRFQGKSVVEYENSRIGTVEVFVTDAQAVQKIFLIIVKNIIQLVIVLALTIIILYLVISRIIVNPIYAIIRDVQKIGEGDLSHRIDLEAHNELSVLENNINQMTKSLALSFEKEKERQSLMKEMELAREIQTSLLPTIQKDRDFEIAASMVPAEEVGGDFYDIAYDMNQHLWFGIGDVSGHGVTPGLIMMMTQTVFQTFHTMIKMKDSTPTDVIISINKVLYENVRRRLLKQHFMTLTILTHVGGGRMLYSGAHLDLVIHRAKTDTFEILPTKGIWLSLKPDIAYKTEDSSFIMEKGDTLILYTDGITEAKDCRTRIPGKFDLLEMEGLVNIIRKHIHKDIESLNKNIIEDVCAYCDDRRDDDLTLLIVRKN